MDDKIPLLTIQPADGIASTAFVTVSQPDPWCVIIPGFVTIKLRRDGRRDVEVAAGTSLSDAARAFLDAVEKMAHNTTR